MPKIEARPLSVFMKLTMKFLKCFLAHNWQFAIAIVKNRVEILCSGLDNMNVRVCMYVCVREREIETQGV